MEKMPITQVGYDNLKVELKKRTSEDRPRIISAISEARSHGDLSENAEYHSAKEEQSLNEGRIQELEDQINRAEIIDYSKFSNDIVKFGATVELEDLNDTVNSKKYQIIGEPEADGISSISIKSPLGKELIGKSVGETATVNTKTYEILSINYDKCCVK